MLVFSITFSPPAPLPPPPHHHGRPYLEDLLQEPAMVVHQGRLVGLVNVDPHEVGVGLVPISVHQALEKHLDEP